MLRLLLHPFPALLVALAALPAAALPPLAAGDRAPAFTGATRWINAPPLSTGGWRGKVLLVDFWIFECINCLHALPQVKALDAKYRGQGLVVVGVHTPELAAERGTGNLLAAVKRLCITFPVAQDNDYATWSTWQDQYRPAQSVIDHARGVIYIHIGEGCYDAIERALNAARAEAH